MTRVYPQSGAAFEIKTGVNPLICNEPSQQGVSTIIIPTTENDGCCNYATELCYKSTIRWCANVCVACIILIMAVAIISLFIIIFSTDWVKVSGKGRNVSEESKTKSGRLPISNNEEYYVDETDNPKNENDNQRNENDNQRNDKDCQESDKDARETDNHEQCSFLTDPPSSTSTIDS